MSESLGRYVPGDSTTGVSIIGTAFSLDLRGRSDIGCEDLGVDDDEMRGTLLV